MGYLRTFIALLLLLPLSAWSADAQTSARGTGAVRLSEETRFYDITGGSENELLRGMIRGGPSHEGTTYFGLTSTEIRYTYRKLVTSTGCHLRDIEVHLQVVVTLPRWRPVNGAPYDLERKWRSFDRNLTIHENGHRQLALEEANMINRALGAVRTTSCEAIDADARDLATRIRDTYVRRHQAYDARTDHGATQGAKWPMR